MRDRAAEEKRGKKLNDSNQIRKSPRTKLEQEGESKKYISSNSPKWRRKENHRVRKEKKQNVQSTFWNTGGHEAEHMAEPEQLQELTHDLGNFIFQIYCTTHTPTHWRIKFAVLLTFINQDSLPKTTDVHLPFLEHRVDSFPHAETTTVLPP